MAPKVKRKKPATAGATPQPDAQRFVIRGERILSRPLAAPRPKAQGAFTDQRLTLMSDRDIDSALTLLTRAGTQSLYYWFVEVKIPAHAANAPTPLITAALHPGGTLPLVPVGADAEKSRSWAALLLALFEDYNRGQGLEFALNLAHGSTFANFRPYEWGDSLDAVCEVCGCVFRHTAFVTLCEDCQRRATSANAEPDHYTAQWHSLVRRVADDLRERGVRP